jgi:ribonuclease VapC
LIIDTSALVAIALQEPEADEFIRLIATSPVAMAAPTILEAALVLRPVQAGWLDEMLTLMQVRTVAFDETHLAVARQAMATYGKGTGSPARLNFGDCLSYAVAKVAGEPLLFKGDDFTHTDIEPAWWPGGH